MIGVCRQTAANEIKLVVVEGNIGAGKTTLTVDLARRLQAKAILEPTAQNPYLEKFYSNPKKYALKLQLWIFRRRLQLYAEALQEMQQGGQTVILDRSVFGDSVFAEVGHRDGNISDEEYECYKQLRQRTLAILPPPDVLIYLDVPPSSCHERIMSRGRECERGIPLDYLTKLDQSYQNFVSDMRLQNTHIVLLDWREFGSVTKVVQAILNASKQSTGKSAMDGYQNCLQRLSTQGTNLWSFVSQGLQTSEPVDFELASKSESFSEVEKKFFYRENQQQLV